MHSQQVPVQTDTLIKNYGKVAALRGVSLQLKPGVTAILGENGAGKTTLIKCALGLEKPSGGDIQVFGASPRQRLTRQRVGVMLQDTELPDLLTGREFITLFASYYPAPLAVEEVIALTRVSEFVDKRYKKLSGGQKRRIQFALAIVGNPDLVFLDEPTTGLDAEARKALWDTVRGFAADGRAIVLTTHYLEEADALADRVIILKEGEVIADADADSMRAGVAGSLIRCATQLGPEQLRTLPGCTDVTLSGRLSEIRSSDAVTTLRALFDLDDQLRDLTISRPRLEDIFAEINR